MTNLVSIAFLTILLLFPAAVTVAGGSRHQTETVISKLESAGGRVWPGYSPLSKPVLLFDESGTAYLINHPDPPKNFSVVQHKGQARVYACEKFQRPSESVFLPDYSFNGIPTFYARRPFGATADNTIKLISHEAFHSFQHARFTPSSAVPPLRTDSEQQAAFYIEELLLAKALISPSNWQDDFRLFLAARHERLAKADSRAKAWEEQNERLEGSAQYVELKYAEPAGHAGSMLTSTDLFLANMLLLPAEKQDDKVKYYLTGAAQMLLLDRLRAPWKTRLENGESIFQLAYEQYKDSLPGKRYVSGLRKKYDYQSLVETFKAKNSETREMDSSDVASFNACSRKFSLLSWDARTFSDAGFTGEKRPVRTADGVFYPSVSTMEFIKDKTLKLVFRNTSVMRTNLKAKTIKGPRGMVIYPTQYEGALGEGKLDVYINGVPTAPTKDGTVFKELRIEGAEISFSAIRAGKVYAADGSITVELQPKSGEAIFAGSE